MSAWPGKFVIGLTGNIATGKSEARRILESFGAFGIDADQLAHQVISPGEQAYTAIVETFGNQILAPDGNIDRLKLGQIVFNDPSELKRLEAIIHPQVRKAVDRMVRQAGPTVVVIEAIKLIESGYPAICDSIWVTAAPEDVQLRRLMQRNGMSQQAAKQRISAQAAQEEKIKAANVVIWNDGSIEDMRRQILSHWQEVCPPS